MLSTCTDCSASEMQLPVGCNLLMAWPICGRLVLAVMNVWGLNDDERFLEQLNIVFEFLGH